MCYNYSVLIKARLFCNYTHERSTTLAIKNKLANALITIMISAVSTIVACSLFVGMLNSCFDSDTPLYFEFASFALMLVWIIAATIIAKIIYEAGHVIIGKIYGYKFIAIGICGIWLIKRDGKIKLTRASSHGINQGTVMAPPPHDGNKISILHYNLSGIIFTSTVAIISIVICLFNGIPNFARLLLAIFAVQNLLLALLCTLIRAENGGLSDILKLLMQTPTSAEKIRHQLKISELLINGSSFSEIDPQALTSEENDVISIRSKRYSYLKMLYSGNFSDAKIGLSNLLEFTTKNSLLYLVISADICVLSLLLGEEYKSSKRLIQHIKSKSYDIPLLRTRYAIELLSNKNEKKAQRIRKKIDRIAKKAIFEGIIKDEFGLIEHIYKHSIKK